MDSTDSVTETARKLIQTDSTVDVFIPAKKVNIGDQYVAIADLQRMARAWLEIRRGINENVLGQDSGNQYDYLRDLFGIAEIEDSAVLK